MVKKRVVKITARNKKMMVIAKQKIRSRYKCITLGNWVANLAIGAGYYRRNGSKIYRSEDAPAVTQRYNHWNTYASGVFAQRPRIINASTLRGCEDE